MKKKTPVGNQIFSENLEMVMYGGFGQTKYQNVLSVSDYICKQCLNEPNRLNYIQYVHAIQWFLFRKL